MSHLIGFSPDVTTTAAADFGAKDFAVLQRTEDDAGNSWLYVQASGSIDKYDGVTVDEAGQATKIAKAGVDDNHKVGVARVAFADNDYGWVQVRGVLEGVNVTGVATTIDLPLYTSGTAGVFSVTSTTAQTMVHGICATANAGTTAEVAVAGLMTVEPYSAAF